MGGSGVGLELVPIVGPVLCILTGTGPGKLVPESHRHFAGVELRTTIVSGGDQVT